MSQKYQFILGIGLVVLALLWFRLCDNSWFAPPTTTTTSAVTTASPATTAPVAAPTTTASPAITATPVASPARIDADRPAPATNQPASSANVNLPVPVDYVLQPQVAPEEAAAGPARIVSLSPNITEIVCALGLRDRLVGRTRYCRHIPGLEKVVEVGVMAESNYGLMLSLKPDLVLAAANSGDMLVNLARLGLRAESVPHESLPDVYIAIKKIGTLCGRPRTAEILIKNIANDLDRLRTAAEALHRPPQRVIVLFGEMPVPPRAVFVAGPGLFLDTLVEYAGHRNAVSEVLHSSQGEIPLELFRSLDPDVILEFRQLTGEQSSNSNPLSDSSSSSNQPSPLSSPSPSNTAVMNNVYQAWSQLGPLKAIDGRRVRTVGGTEWLTAGPRIAIELHRMISILSN